MLLFRYYWNTFIVTLFPVFFFTCNIVCQGVHRLEKSGKVRILVENDVKLKGWVVLKRLI